MQSCGNTGSHASRLAAKQFALTRLHSWLQVEAKPCSSGLTPPSNSVLRNGSKRISSCSRDIKESRGSVTSIACTWRPARQAGCCDGCQTRGTRDHSCASSRDTNDVGQSDHSTTVPMRVFLGAATVGQYQQPTPGWPSCRRSSDPAHG